MSVDDLYALPDDPMAELARLRRDLDEFKGKQLIGNTFKTFGVSSTDQWDMNTTLSQNQYNRFLVTYHYANSVDHAVTQMTYYYRLNNPNVMGDPLPRYPPNNPQIEVAARKIADDPTSSSWDVIVFNVAAVPATYTAYMKLFFASTDNGDFTIDIV